VKTPAVDPTTGRLAFFTQLLGDARLRAYSTGVIDPETRKAFEYRDGFFLTSRPGMPVAPPGEAAPEPVPVVP
jgi:hypothetical protein